MDLRPLPLIFLLLAEYAKSSPKVAQKWYKSRAANRPKRGGEGQPWSGWAATNHGRTTRAAPAAGAGDIPFTGLLPLFSENFTRQGEAAGKITGEKKTEKARKQDGNKA